MPDFSQTYRPITARAYKELQHEYNLLNIEREVLVEKQRKLMEEIRTRPEYYAYATGTMSNVIETDK